MEPKQFTSEALSLSPYPNEGFQADRFTKINNFLNIPDTIPEQSSAELSGDSLRMEVPKVLTENVFNDEENNSNQQIVCDETSDGSKITIDNSYIINCERKLLENSNSDEEKSIVSENNSLIRSKVWNIPRRSTCNNDTVSTPPSVLRKEISLLRSEMAEADEFHDLEIQVLKEEKFGEVDTENYLQLFEKYSALMELYMSLKKEYEDFRKDQEKVRRELQSKTADCLESLCSQIEASDNSLNFSNTSFVSFGGGIKSSTMMEEFSEVEATIVHDGTVLANDPLSITCNVFKTPLNTPLKSAKKVHSQELNTTIGKPVVKEVKEILAKSEKKMPLDSECNIQLLNLETALSDKMKEVENLEKRLFKVEDMSGVLQSELERMTKSLSQKTQQLNELTNKLITEIVSMNPTLKESLSEVPATNLLVIFIETIMEKCKKIQDELIRNHNSEKANWEANKKLESITIENLQNQLDLQSSKLVEMEELKQELEKKLSDAESTILTREVEMRILQSTISQTREDFTSAAETLAKTESQLLSTETEKKNIEDKCIELEKMLADLQEESDAKESLRLELDKTKSDFENIQKENENLKKLREDSEEVLTNLKSESLKIKEDLEEEIKLLKNKENTRFEDFFKIIEECKKILLETISSSSETFSKDGMALELVLDKLTENPDSLVLGVVQSITEYLKIEWETKRTFDKTLTENLQNQIKTLTEKTIEYETKFEDSNRLLSARDEEIIVYKKQEDALQQTKEELEGTLLKLKSQLSSTELEKKEIETQYQNLQETLESLKLDLASKESILPDYESTKLVLENLQRENHDLKETIQQSEEMMSRLKSESLQLNSKFSKNLFDILEECKIPLTEILSSSETSPEENLAINLICEKLTNDSDSQLLSIFEAVSNYLKIEWESKRNSELPSINELQNQIQTLTEKIAENEAKLSELVAENEKAQKLSENLKNQLRETEILLSSRDEELLNFKKQEHALEQMKVDFISENDTPNERLDKLISRTTEFQSSNKETKMVSVFMESIIETQEGVKREFIKKLESQKLEWETIRKGDLEEIDNLQNQLKSLQSTVNHTQEGFTSAAEKLEKLESQLVSTENDRKNYEGRCKELEEMLADLKQELDAKETLLLELDKTKLNFENIQKENEDLKKLMEESDEVLTNLKSESLKIKEELEKEIKLLKNKENTRFEALFEIIEKSKKILIETLSSSSEIYPKESIALGLILENLTENHDSLLLTVVESITEFLQIEWETKRTFDKTLIDNLQNQIKALTEKTIEYETKLEESSRLISARDEEIVVYKKQEDVLQQTKAQLELAEETLLKLKSELSSTELEKKEVETQYHELQETLNSLKRELLCKESIVPDYENTKLVLENLQKENYNLKETIQQSEETMAHLKSELLLKSSRFETLFGILEECKNPLADLLSNSETSSEEYLAVNLVCEKLANNSDSQVLSIFEAVANYLKIEWESNRHFGLSVINGLQNQIKILTEKIAENEAKFSEMVAENEAKFSEMVAENEAKFSKIVAENEAKCSEIIAENEKAQKLSQNLRNQLRETEILLSERNEEIMNFKNQERALEQMKNDFLSEETETFDERVKKLISTTAEFENSHQDNSLVSVFIETIVETQEGVKREFIKKLESQKLEWESKRKGDLEDIDNLQNQLNSLQFTLNQTRENFTSVAETLAKLESQLISTETEKKNIEARCEELEKRLADLQRESDDTESLRLELDRTKLDLESIQKENYDLKKLLEQSEEALTNLKLESLKIKEELEEEIKLLKNKENAKSEALLEILEESKKILMETISSSLETSKENTALGSISKKLSENLKNQLLEIETLSSCDEDLIKSKKQEHALVDLVTDEADTPNKRLNKLITKTTEFRTCHKETKMVSVFVETIIETQEGVKREFTKKLESQKLEWESRRKEDLEEIDNLHNQVKSLSKINQQNEDRITEINHEKDDLKKLHDALTNRIKEAESIIAMCNEEIRSLQTQEEALKQTRDELKAADETILLLKSELTSTKGEKDELEHRCRKLQESATNLQTEIDTKETIIKGLDDLKMIRERMECENKDLKQEITQSEDVIMRLKNRLEAVTEEQTAKESRIKSLLDEIESLKKEKESLSDFSEKFERLEKSNKNLVDIFSDVQLHLNLPEDTMSKLMSGNFENKKIFSERINNLMKTQTESLKSENKSLKIGNENLKEKVRQLNKLISESANPEGKEDSSIVNTSMNLRSRSNKSMDLCVRRLDKLEEINHCLTDLITQILMATEFPDCEKLQLCSPRSFPSLTKKVLAHLNDFQSKLKELKEENAQLDEECETYSNIIKELKKEAAAVWKTNKEKTESMEAEISKLTEEKNSLEKERQKMQAKLSTLEAECQKLKSSKTEAEPPHNCTCGNESKKINDLKRAILIKEQKLLELQDLEAQTNSYKSQIEYLKTALEREKKKMIEEKEKNKKLQNELSEATKNQKVESKKTEENQVLDELRMRGSISGGVVQEYVDKEKMRKLSKDIGILKELCRARYAEIKRLEAVNAALKNNLPKNSNQMDSPIRTRAHSTRSKNLMKDVWKSELSGKENSPF